MSRNFDKRDNSGTLGRNKNKTKETHPSHKGSAIIDGVDYWISAWVKEGTDGKFFSLAFEKKDANRNGHGPAIRLDRNGG